MWYGRENEIQDKAVACIMQQAMQPEINNICYKPSTDDTPKIGEDFFYIANLMLSFIMSTKLDKLATIKAMQFS